MLTGEGIMVEAGSPARPSFSRAPWVVEKRVRERRLKSIERECPVCQASFNPWRENQMTCSLACSGTIRQRPCPDDFEQIFVTIGRYLCQEWYRCNRTTVTRWLEQCGKQRLLHARRDHVRARYKAEREQRLLDQRMRAAMRDRYQAASVDLTDGDELGVGSVRL